MASNLAKAYYRIVSVLVIYPALKKIGVGASNSNQICLNEIIGTTRFGVEMPLIDIVFLLLVVFIYTKAAQTPLPFHCFQVRAIGGVADL